MKILLTVISFFAATICFGQQFIATDPPAYETQIFDNLNKHGGNADNGIVISGSPFWKDEWVTGELFNYNGLSYGRFLVKINFAEGQVHFLNKKNIELVALENKVQKIIIYDKVDTGTIVARFSYNTIPELTQLSKSGNNLMQELNQGNIQLLKLANRQVQTADSLFGTLKRYFYSNKYDYFIQKGDRIEKLRKLNKESFLPQIPLASKYNDWIKQKNLKFKTEADFTDFLTYYNIQESKK